MIYLGEQKHKESDNPVFPAACGLFTIPLAHVSKEAPTGSKDWLLHFATRSRLFEDLQMHC